MKAALKSFRAVHQRGVHAVTNAAIHGGTSSSARFLAGAARAKQGLAEALTLNYCIYNICIYNCLLRGS